VTDSRDTTESTEVTDTEAIGAAPEAPETPDSTDSTGTGASGRRLRFPLLPVALAAALIVSAVLAGWVYFDLYRPDRQTDAAVAETVVKAATDGTVAMLTYAPDTLEGDFANAKNHLTGDFLSYYTDFTEKVVTPAAKQKHVTTSAQVVRAALAELNPDSAVVLLFVNQTTISDENPDGAFASSSVQVGLTKTGDAWLISSFDPI